MRSYALRAIAAAVILGTGAALSAQTFRTSDEVLRRLWVEGMERSEAESLAQVLVDTIGPRRVGTAGYDAAVEWVERRYRDWNIPVRREWAIDYPGWRSGALHVDLISPRIQTLDAHLLALSRGTDGPIDGDVVIIPELRSEDAAAAFLARVRDKFVLASPVELSCREPQAFERLARPSTVARLRADQAALAESWRARRAALGAIPHQALADAGAVAVLTSRWSQGWGVNKILEAATADAVSIDLSCEDYGLLYRLAVNDQAPRLRIDADAEVLSPVPQFNVVAELRGTELPDEYVMLSAHLDSWHGATGATDNGTGTVTMLEAMRMLKAAYPNPRRTILVGHWAAEETGLDGSRAFAEDHPDVVAGLQALFNQDNGTWRVEYIQAQGLLGASGHLARWVAALPTELSEHITLDLPGPQETGGSDHVSFLCHGAPGFRLQSNYPDYRQYTWHTNRDTYDKIVLDDLRNNATLAAMLAYLASEDPERVPRDRAILTTPQGRPRPWVPCAPVRRSPAG